MFTELYAVWICLNGLCFGQTTSSHIESSSISLSPQSLHTTVQVFSSLFPRFLVAPFTTFPLVASWVANVDKLLLGIWGQLKARHGTAMEFSNSTISWSRLVGQHLRCPVASWRPYHTKHCQRGGVWGFSAAGRVFRVFWHRTCSKSFREFFFGKDRKNNGNHMKEHLEHLKVPPKNTYLGILYNAPQSTSHSWDSYDATSY